jgi:Bacterial capsule synthesis protein PGA_cap
MIDSKMLRNRFHDMSISPPKNAQRTKTTISFSGKINNKIPKLISAIPSEERILFVGDTSFGDNYISEYENRKKWGFNILKEYGHDYFFQKLRPLLFDVDTVVANLETPLINKESITRPTFSFSPQSRYIQKQGRFQHWSDGPISVEYLRKNNISTVSLANNHMLDYGKEGLLQTIAFLRKGGIRFFGANVNARCARYPFIKNIFSGNGKLKLVIISAFENRAAYDNDFSFYAAREKTGVNRLSVNKITEMIRQLKGSAFYDEVFVVAFPHWGGRRNYGWSTNRQRKLGHQLIEAGADIVIGHGPHNLQEIEEYRGRLILYSIGNFMYNSLGKYNTYNALPYSLAVELIFRTGDRTATAPRHDQHNKGSSFAPLRKFIKLYPILTDNNMTNFQTRFLNSSEFDIVYKTLIDKSPDFKSSKNLSKPGMDRIGHYIELSLIN